MRPQVWHESLLLSRSLKGNLIYKFHQGCFVSRARMGLWSKQRVTKCIRCTGTVSYKLERSEVYMSQLDPLPRQNTWHSCVAETFPLFYWKIKIFTFLQGFCSLVEKQPHSFPPSIRHHSYCIWVIALPDWNSILWIWAAVYPVESCVHRRANTESTLREKNGGKRCWWHTIVHHTSKPNIVAGQLPCHWITVTWSLARFASLNMSKNVNI